MSSCSVLPANLLCLCTFLSGSSVLFPVDKTSSFPLTYFTQLFCSTLKIVAENRDVLSGGVSIYSKNELGFFYYPLSMGRYTIYSGWYYLHGCCKFNLGGGYLSVISGEPFVYTSHSGIFHDEWFRWRCAIYK